jgi:hypothetical protein
MQAVALPLSRDAVAIAPTNKWLITVSISFGTLMGAIDASIVNVALPHLQGALGASVQEITWVRKGVRGRARLADAADPTMHDPARRAPGQESGFVAHGARL